MSAATAVTTGAEQLVRSRLEALGSRIVSDRDSIALDLDGAWFDLAEFRRIAAEQNTETSALIDACDLHRGDLMSGFGLRDSPSVRPSARPGCRPRWSR